MRLLVIALSFPSLQVSAKSLPLEPPDPSRGVIGVRVGVVPPAKLGWKSADSVYFVRVVEDGDMLNAESVIPSNYSNGKDVYLLNARPGRYVAVACMWESSGPTPAVNGVVAFAAVDIPRTLVEVVPGGTVFMGFIETGSSTKVEAADSAQSHYLRMVAPTAARESFLGRAMTGHYTYVATFKSISRDLIDELEFWSAASQKDFKRDEAWARVMSQRAGSTTRRPPTPVAAAPVTDTKISKDRVAAGVYTSPGGEYHVKLPELVQPGARSEERQTGPSSWGVFFTDDFGHVYFILRSDNSVAKQTLEQYTADIQVGDAIRSKETIDAPLASQVRVTGVIKNGSPLEANGVHPDLVKASSLFLYGTDAYEVSAAVTRLHDDQPDDALLEQAKNDL